MIVTDTQVEAALDIQADVERGVVVKYNARMAEYRLDRKRAEIHRSLNTGTVADKEAAVCLHYGVIELQDALAVAEAEVDRWRGDRHKADTLIDLYRTESANARGSLI